MQRKQKRIFLCCQRNKVQKKLNSCLKWRIREVSVCHPLSFCFVFHRRRRTLEDCSEGLWMSDKGVIGTMFKYEGLWKFLELSQLKKRPPIIMYIMKYCIKWDFDEFLHKSFILFPGHLWNCCFTSCPLQAISNRKDLSLMSQQ